MSSQTIIRKEKIKTTRQMLMGWIEAEKAVMTGQEYRIGSRTLRRANLPEIGERIKYWSAELDRLVHMLI